MSILTVILTDDEIEVIRLLSELRHKYARDRGINDCQVGGQSSLETDLTGLCAEFAFCKHFNIYPDLGVVSVKPYDCLLFGRTFDVKGTHYSSGKLILRKTENHVPCDYYALVTGEGNNWIVRGYMSASEFLVDDRIGRMKQGAPLSYIADQSDLRIFKKHRRAQAK